MDLYGITHRQLQGMTRWQSTYGSHKNVWSASQTGLIITTRLMKLMQLTALLFGRFAIADNAHRA